MNNRIFPISMALLWGISFANALHSLSLGICMGLCMGAAFGLFGSGNDAEEK